MKKPLKKITVVLEQEKDGSGWTIRAKEIQGCHTYGKTVPQALRRMAEAMPLFKEEYER